MEEHKDTSTAPISGEQAGGSADIISMEQWEDQLEETLAGSTLKHGELREGIIIDRKSNGLVVDIGAKRDGFVPLEDLEDLGDEQFAIGQDVPVVVTKFRDSDGNVELSISQALLQEDWIKAEKMLEEETLYEANVLASNRGGLTVEFGRLRGFIPMSQLIGFGRIRQASERHRRLRAMVGQSVMLKVIEVNRRRRRLILSQQAAAKEWRTARRQKLMEELEAGQIRRGRISQITSFGLFVNLGGLDGLVHISELSWGRIEDPAEIFRPGQRIKVRVLSVDHERQRIALSIKALVPDPWIAAPEKYKEGTLVEGKVSQIVDFGIFVELEPGVEGLLHNSELRDLAQREELEAGQSVLVKVIRVEPDRRRIGLSVQRVQPEEWEEWALAQAEAQAAAEAAGLQEPADDEDEDSDDDTEFGADEFGIADENEESEPSDEDEMVDDDSASTDTEE